MGDPAANDSEVVLKQLFQFWYYASLLLQLRLANADMTADFTRLLRVLEEQSLLPSLPITDIGQAGWSIKNIMLDSMDKVEGLLWLPRPSSTSMAGRIVEISIAVSRMLARSQSSQPPPGRPFPPGSPSPSCLVGRAAAGGPANAPGRVANAANFRCPSPPSSPAPSTCLQGPCRPAVMAAMTDMREEYFQGACHVATASAETLFGLVRLIVPVDTFTYPHPVPEENVPFMVSCAVAWGLGSKALRLTPTRISSLTYGEIVNALMLSGKSLHRSAVPAAAKARPGPGCAPRPGMASCGAGNGARGNPPIRPPWTMGPSQGVGQPSHGPPPPSMRPGMQPASQPYSAPGQPRAVLHGQDNRARWISGMEQRQGPGFWRPLGPQRSIQTVTSDSDSDSDSSESKSATSSDSDSDSDSEHGRCACAKKAKKSKGSKGSKGSKSCKSCSSKTKKSKGKSKKSTAKHGSKKRGQASRGTDVDSDSGDDSDASSHDGSVSGSDADSYCDVHSGTDSDSVVDVDSGSDSDSGSESDADRNRRKKSRRRAKAATAKQCCQKCEERHVGGFVMVSRRGAKK